MSVPFRIGDHYRFTYGMESQHDVTLTIERITGTGPDDFVFWSDHTHTKVKDMPGIEDLRVLDRRS